jgi:hypothetical protein
MWYVYDLTTLEIHGLGNTPEAARRDFAERYYSASDTEGWDDNDWVRWEPDGHGTADHAHYLETVESTLQT